MKSQTELALALAKKRCASTYQPPGKLLQKSWPGWFFREIGTHTARRVNGEKTPLRMLGLGLHGYSVFEEGLATGLESAYAYEVAKYDQETSNIIKPSKGMIDDFRGIDGYLPIGLCMGIDGEKRDFRQVFEILQAYFYFNNLKSGKLSVEEATSKANDSAWNRSIRTFRGTNCQMPGICYTKDIEYRQGSIAFWDHIQDYPEDMNSVNIGKYDPSNIEHLMVLAELGILSVDSDKIENMKQKRKQNRAK